jgi:hypothetical protein
MLLHKALSSLQSKDEAFKALRDLAFFAKKQKTEQTQALRRAVAGAVGGRGAVIKFLSELISISAQGETAALATATCLWIMGQLRGQDDWTIQVHPVNECGASSNEIGDIDVYAGEELVLTMEVKDKDFRMHDVEHAVQKVAAAEHDSLHFVCGPQGKLVDRNDAALEEVAGKNHVQLFMHDLQALINTTVAFAPGDLEIRTVAAVLRQFAEEARVRPETIRHLTEILGREPGGTRGNPGPDRTFSRRGGHHIAQHSENWNARTAPRK